MSWTAAQLSRLIDLFRANEVLYRQDDPLYRNKLARWTARKRIAAGMLNVRPSTTVKEVAFKINDLIKRFTKLEKELLGRNSRAGGSGSDHVLPKTCFVQLLFLRDHLLDQPNSNVPRVDIRVESLSQNTTITTSFGSESQEPLNEEFLIEMDQGTCQASTSYEIPADESVKEEFPIEMDQGTCQASTSYVIPEAPAAVSEANPSSQLEIVEIKKENTTEIAQDGPLNATDDKLLTHEENPPNANEYDHFVQYIAGELRTFESNELRKKCKREMIHVLMHFQELDEEQ